MRLRLRAAWEGGWLVRAAQTGLSWGITVGLFLHPTDLQRQVAEGELLEPLLFLSSVLLSVLLYYVVSLMDPGYVEHGEDEKEPGSKEPKTVTSQQLPAVRLRRCGYCMVKQPMRAKHCRDCQHCVRRYDHHCPWIENCVGERNHPLFVVYLAVQLVVLVWAMEVAWSGLRFEPFSWAWLQRNLLLLLSFLVTVVGTVVAVLLLTSHLYLISCNTTTWEYMSRHRISYLRQCEAENPFDQGLFRNLWKFFCACRLVRWEALYPQDEGSAV